MAISLIGSLCTVSVHGGGQRHGHDWGWTWHGHRQADTESDAGTEQRKTVNEFLSSYVFLVLLCILCFCRLQKPVHPYCTIPGDNPPKDWQSLPCSMEEPDSNLRLLRSQLSREMRYCNKISNEMSSLYFGIDVFCQFEARVPEFQM